MPQCPQCNKPLVNLSRQCPSCRADLDLLVDYVYGLQGSLTRAEEMTRAGELGQAVWAYLEVLEVDPDNPAARQQVGQIATAVRQFDRTVPGRRWAQGLPPAEAPDKANLLAWLKRVAIGLAVLLVFGLGFFCGQALQVEEPSKVQDKKEQKKDPLPPRPNQHLGLDRP
jgi:hypothetical protein